MKAKMAAMMGLLFTGSSLASAQTIQKQSLGPVDVSFSAESFQGPSRKIMRLSDGRIYASLLSIGPTGDGIHLLSALNSGPIQAGPGPNAQANTWTDVTGTQLTSDKARSIASDTGPNGTYVAYVNIATNAAELLFFPDPAQNPGQFVRFSSLSSSSSSLTDSFVAATKGSESANTVVYGWRDADHNSLTVGVSPDGRAFPPGKVVVSDSQLKSGPTLAVHNNYILLSYLSGSPQYRPKSDLLSSDTAYPVSVESWDGGQTWSEPRAVLGTEVTRFPNVDYAKLGLNPTSVKGSLIAAGGGLRAGNVLAWSAPGIGARIFVLSEQRVLSSDAGTNALLRANPASVGVLAFKDLSEGPQAAWNTVVASAPLGTSDGPDAIPVASDFQYSALPGTSVRAVAYRSSPRRDSSSDGEGVTVSISRNTGQSFDEAVFIPKSALGLGAKQPLLFTTSTCVGKNDDGSLFLDIAYLDINNKASSAQLPLKVNLKELPPSMFNTVARWP